MTFPRLLAIGFIFVCAAVAWFALGTSVKVRSGEFDGRLEHEVAQLWGGHHNQQAPQPWYWKPRKVTEEVAETGSQGQKVTRLITKTVNDRVPIPLESSRLNVDLKLEHRRKGLLWFDTYGVQIAGIYRFRNPDSVSLPVFVDFNFPSTEGIYDQFVFRVNGQDVSPKSDLAQGLTANTVLPVAGEGVIEVSYRSRGLGHWLYSFAPSGVSQVRDFQLVMTTDFDKIDFPAGTISPSTRVRQGSGWKLTWTFDSLVTGQRLGMDLPNKLNPGPLTARVTFFAPVSLLFFLTVLVILGVLNNQALHPMNYFFLAAAFFSFHLLLAYLVDHINLHAAFAIASVASIFLVISYLRLVGGLRFALLQAGVAQLVFLVLFSYAFFFEGYAGLTVTIGAVVTLFVLMQLTGGVDWSQVFVRSRIRQSEAEAQG